MGFRETKEETTLDYSSRRENQRRAADETSVIGLMEFTMGGSSYGINVSKVTEIMRRCKITPMTHSHFCVDGVFKPRDKIITIINLPRYMHLP